MPDPGSLLQGTFSFLSGTLTDLVLIPVYTFLLLYYRDLFVRFLVRTIGGAQPADLLAMLTKVRLLTRQYVGGLLIEMLIIASLNAVGFFIVGMKYALLSALIVALLNLIPYLGIFMACALSLLINVHNNPPGIALRVIGVLLAVHLLDAYLIYPKIVGSKVRINALAVIVGVVTGGTLWGIPGMFLALPAIAMLKAILEESDNLQPWGLLLGGNITGSHPASKDSAEKNPTDSTDP